MFWYLNYILFSHFWTPIFFLDPFLFLLFITWFVSAVLSILRNDASLLYVNISDIHIWQSRIVHSVVPWSVEYSQALMTWALRSMWKTSPFVSLDKLYWWVPIGRNTRSAGLTAKFIQPLNTPKCATSIQSLTKS